MNRLLLLRWALGAAGVLTALVAALVLVLIAANPDQMFVWPRVFVSLFILAGNAAFFGTVQWAWPIGTRWLLGTAAAFAAIGGLGAAHAISVARALGDAEYWVILACLILLAQGVGTVVYIRCCNDATCS